MSLPTDLRFLETVSLGEAFTAALIIYAIYKYVRVGLPRTRQFFRMLDTWFGDPRSPNPEEQGVLRRLSKLEERTRELITNHGESVKDRVDQISTRTGEMQIQQNEIAQRLEQHVSNSNVIWGSNVLEQSMFNDRLARLERMILDERTDLSDESTAEQQSIQIQPGGN
jgi:hypothetical protein